MILINRSSEGLINYIIHSSLSVMLTPFVLLAHWARGLTLRQTKDEGDG